MNRTLRSLEMDGNDIGLEGLQAFRGCLYGNNKLIHCPVPLRDLQAHIDQAQAVIRQAVHDEMHARAGVKVACRMRNYHMKAQELEKLRQAIRTRKRLDSRVQKCQSLMGVIQQSVGNNQKIYAKKEEEKRLKLEVKMKEKEERMLKKAQEQEEKRKKKQRELEFRKAERERKMLQKKALKGRVTALHKYVYKSTAALFLLSIHCRMDRQIAIEQAKGADVQWYYNWKNTVADKRYLTKGDFASVSTHYAAHCQAVGTTTNDATLCAVAAFLRWMQVNPSKSRRLSLLQMSTLAPSTTKRRCFAECAIAILATTIGERTIMGTITGTAGAVSVTFPMGTTTSTTRSWKTTNR